MISSPVIVVCGGVSPEHDVSCASGESVLRILQSIAQNVGKIVISKQGHWLFSPDVYKDRVQAISHHPKDLLFGYAKQIVGDKMLSVGDICVFPVIHGVGGEDGSLQGYLEHVGCSYIGSGVLGSSLGLHKGISKIIAQHIGIPVVGSQEYSHTMWRKSKDAVLSCLMQFASGNPIVIKPMSLGSSVGVFVAQSKNSISCAIERVLELDQNVLCEQLMRPKIEMECAVIEDKDGLHASAVGAVQYQDDVLSYEDKYTEQQNTQLLSRVDDRELEHHIQQSAIQLFRKLQLRGYARIDGFYLPEEEKWYFNEVNTLPGLGENSHFLALWRLYGWSDKAVVQKLVEFALL